MAQIGRAEAERIMREAGWLAQVPEVFREEVLRRSLLTRFAAGAAIFTFDDPPGGLFGLVGGIVSINVAPKGVVPQLIMLGVPGHWTGEGGFLTRQPRRLDMRAVRDTTAFCLPLDVLDQMAARDPDVTHHIAIMLTGTVEFLLGVVHDLQKPEADRRIASVLHRSSRIGNMPIPLTQAEVGVMANVSRKQVNAALKRFCDAGWLEHSYRSIIVTNPAALRAFAESDDTV